MGAAETLISYIVPPGDQDGFVSTELDKATPGSPGVLSHRPGES